MTDERPHCLNPVSCAAKTPGKHCPPCSWKIPGRREKMADAQRRCLADPAALERRRAGARKAGSDPQAIRKRAAATKERMADPKVREAHRQRCKESARERMAANPKLFAIYQSCGVNYGKHNFAAANTPEKRAQAAASCRAKRMSWCPEEFWPLNEALKRKGYRLPERKAIILADVPGTTEHARRAVSNAALSNRIRHERDLAQRY